MSQNFEPNNEATKDVPGKLALRFSAPDIEDVFPLSSTQAGMVFHSLFAPEAGLYLEQIVWRIEGELDIRLLETAWQRVVEHQAILRTSFRWDGLDNPLQIVPPGNPPICAIRLARIQTNRTREPARIVS